MAARSGMADLITRVRALTSAGTADYTVAGATFWTDDQVQDALDRCRRDIHDEAVSPLVTYNSGGTAEYKTYELGHANLEATTGGTAVFYLREATGARVGTALYTPDYERGEVEFASSVTGGSVLYLTGRSYDVYAAAADIWRQKAAHVADRFDFSADDASFKASQLMAQYERQAQALERRATFGASGVNAVTMYRDDVNLWHAS